MRFSIAAALFTVALARPAFTVDPCEGDETCRVPLAAAEVRERAGEQVEALQLIQVSQVATSLRIQTMQAKAAALAEKRARSNDPFAKWLTAAAESAGRLRLSLVRTLGPVLSPPASGKEAGKENVAALQSGALPASSSVPGAAPGFTGNDALTIAPGVVVMCILVGLISSFMSEMMQADKASEGAEEKEGKLEDAAAGAAPGVKGTSGSQTVFNIVKNIVGEGILSLPAGVAAGTGLLGSMVIATGFCMMLGYTFSLMGRVCHATGGATHKACAESSSGKGMARFISVTLMLKTLGSCLSYAIVISESFSRILHFFGFQGIFTSKQAVLLGMMAFVLVPLCLQRDLSILSYTSLVGLCLEFFVVAFMQVRYLDGSYTPGGKYYKEIEAKYQPDFEEGVNYWGTSITTFVLLGALSTAYIAHYNAPKFYSQMKTKTVAQFNKVITVAFLFSLMMYLWIMCVGYLTFGQSCDGLVLNNYAESDAGATMARVAIGFAVVFGFPLAFTALRDSTMSVFGLDPQKGTTFHSVTFALLAPIALIGCFLHDLGLVNSLMGAFFGGLIVLAFPGLLTYYAGVNTQGGKQEFSRFEIRGAWLWVALGLVLSSLGSVIVCIKKFAPDLLK